MSCTSVFTKDDDCLSLIRQGVKEPTEVGAKSREHANALPQDKCLSKGYLPDKVLESVSKYEYGSEFMHM